MECDIASYHVESFNYLLAEGINLAAISVPVEKFRLSKEEAVEIRYTGAHIGHPMLEDVTTSRYATQSRLSKQQEVDAMKIYPSECRQRGITYRAQLRATLDVSVNGRHLDLIEDKVIGDVPIMLRSQNCNLFALNREQLIAAGEEGTECGGYFICKGSEKMIRLLVVMRRNYPLAMVRNRYRERGKLFSQYAIAMRCVRVSLLYGASYTIELVQANHTAAMLTLHYLENGTISVAFQSRREIFFVPLMYILKALVDMNDREIYEALMRLRPNDQFWDDCVGNMISSAQSDGVVSNDVALKVIGKLSMTLALKLFKGARFRIALGSRVAPWESDRQVGEYLLHTTIAIHIDNTIDKFWLLVYSSQKLIALVKGECQPESPDNPQFQEALVSGHLILMIIRDRLEASLATLRRNIEALAKRKSTGGGGDDFTLSSQHLSRAMSMRSSRSSPITYALEYFLATGNLSSQIHIAVQQTTGFSIIAERINQLRFVSHFRAIHRGAFFTEMRTTDVRKLRPEGWGFICPVHTPDGAPCGLLNHLTASCRIVTNYLADKKAVILLLNQLGMIDHSSWHYLAPTNDAAPLLYPVFFDGHSLGYIVESGASLIEKQLRAVKIDSLDNRIPDIAEITLIRHSPDSKEIQTQYAGLYLFTEPSRLIRPVRNVEAKKIEFIGTFEQVYLSVCIDPDEAEPGVTYHQELAANCLFSFAANLIPFPDHNQSPRNVYQCQMGKQTMGTPVHAWPYRADNKMYRIQTPQSPLVQPEAYDRYQMDNYPLGTNAIVAVISYTGYDMEDAMVINKASFERGFGHGTIVKVERINLRAERGSQTIVLADPDNRKLSHYMTADGLPIAGRLYFENDPYLCTFDVETSKFLVKKFKSSEPAYCGRVRIIADTNNEPIRHVLIEWRISRNPIIGDKFASRHGQKGINSFLWPAESLPFSETGMVPDILFNPHGFPSRMTIGMMIESMAGKAAALHAWKQDATPFVFNEQHTAIDYFGELLSKAGFNYYGNECMYSGIDGRPFEVQIFFGLVYYQRLRHMIADKFQVRATGPVDPITMQPIKGRKRAGGIRFGEMERDALIGHGIALTLQDRLLNCSDRDAAHVCTRCGSLLSVSMMTTMGINRTNDDDNGISDHSRRPCCRSCDSDDRVQVVQVPRVFRYLTAELVAMNIKVQLKAESYADAAGR